MAEEPISSEEWAEEDDDAPAKSLRDRIQDLRNGFRKKLAEGSVWTLALLFVCGALFGAAAKAVAARSILIGYWDYTIGSREKTAVNLNAVQQELAARQEEASKPKEDSTPQTGNASDDEAASNDAQGESTKEMPPLPPTPEPPAPPETGKE